MPRHPVASALLLGTLTASSAWLLPSPADAQQVQVTVRGQVYEVTTFDGSYNDQPDFFAPPPPQGQGRMAWWGDDLLAEEFADAVGASLTNTITLDQGVYFAFTADDQFVTSAVLALNGPGSTSEVSIVKNERMIYAILAPNQPLASVPGPLPIFGAASCFGWSRRLRKRITPDRR